MNTKHTPGTWHWRGQEVDPDANNNPYYWISAEPDSGWRDDGTYFSVSGCVSEADARLVAAAPEMLQALREAKDYMLFVEDCEEGMTATTTLLFERIEKLIAKATGEQA